MIKSLKDLLDKFSRFTNSLVYDGGICKRLYRLNFILTTPFKWEGVKKYQRANEVIQQIKNDFKNVCVYSNDELLNFGNLGIAECFKLQNENFNKLIKDK